MVRINALPQALLNDTNIPVNHFRKNLSMCFETMFPSIIPNNPNATLAERITALGLIEDEDYIQPNWANAESSEESSEDSSDGSGMDNDYGGGRRKRRKRTRRKRTRRKRKRKKTRRKRKKTRRKSKRRRKTRKK